MLNMISINLDSITTQEAFIINKATDRMEKKWNLHFREVYSKQNDSPNKYIGYCAAEMRFADELDVDMPNTSFLVKVVLSAEFSSPDCSVKFQRMNNRICSITNVSACSCHSCFYHGVRRTYALFDSYKWHNSMIKYYNT